MTKAARTKDIDLRLFITHQLLASGIKREDIRHEITLDQASSDGRADMVVLDDRWLTGIELKSGSDKLDRCATQAGQYAARFDQSILVADVRLRPPMVEYQSTAWDRAERRNVDVVRQRNPSNDTGFPSLYAVERNAETGAIEFVRDQKWGCGLNVGAPWQENAKLEREQRRGHAPIVLGSMMSLLWADEVRAVACQLVADGKIPPAPGPQRCVVIPHLQERASVAMVRPLIVQRLRTRRLNKWEEAFWRTFDAQVQGEAA
jgi:hypothetical protein